MNESVSPVIDRVQRCLLCRGPVECQCEGRFVTTSCLGCRAVLRIEFDPPDSPGLRARIERLGDVDDSGGAELLRVETPSTRDAA